MHGYVPANTKQVNSFAQAFQQGGVLRDTVMQSIIKRDPLYSCSTSLQKPMEGSQGEAVELLGTEVSLAEKHKFMAYLDEMQANKENYALGSVTESTCGCSTCKSFDQLSRQLQSVPAFNSTSSCGLYNLDCSYRFKQSLKLLRYVNSVKVTIYSFILSNEGKMRCLQNSGQNVSKSNVRSRFNQFASGLTYFIEYEIPHSLKKTVKSRAKVDTGLNTRNVFKFSSKGLMNNGNNSSVYLSARFKPAIILVVYFNQASLHYIENIDNIANIVMPLKISCRGMRGTHRKPIVLGTGQFHFRHLLTSYSQFTNAQEVAILLTIDSPMVTGRVRIELQLGCDKLYFGKEFLDYFQSQIANSVITCSIGNCEKSFNCSDDIKQNKQIKKRSENPKTDARENSNETNNEERLSQIKFSSQIERMNQETILFGFILVSQVQYTRQYQETFFTCQPFCQHDFINSNVTNASSNCFNFYQVIPYIYDDHFLVNLRDNYMIFEFFGNSVDVAQSPQVIGISKVSLHQYYLAFRNPTIVKYLARNQLPVIGTDWYEPIVDPIANQITGKVQILVALGSEVQIHNLKKERGFMDDVVRRRTTTFARAVTKTRPILKERNPPETHKTRFRTNSVCKTLLPTNRKSQMDENNSEKHDEDDCAKIDNRLEAIQNYLQQLVAMKNEEKYDENAIVSKVSLNAPPNLNATQTITNANETSNVTSTSDLLESLQNAISTTEVPKKDTFKAQIVVESALHLPARKKCRVRKVKGKVIREELWPSTYVSYELRDGNVKTTTVVQKSTSPTWNMKSDVFLPLDLITNCNRRLLFKVWKKSNNGSTIPNMQIDTIIGFATVDLTVLLAGLPTIEGWFNIMDLGNKCNGQIKINVIPLENLTKYNIPLPRSTTDPGNLMEPSSYTTPPCDFLPFDDSLSRALKRKFSELEDISQRLKTRLNDVTDDLIDDTDTFNDDIADEFEKDINTLCVEEDYDLLDFTKAAQDLNMQRVSSSLQKWQEAIGNSAELALQISVPVEQQATLSLQLQHFVSHHSAPSDLPTPINETSKVSLKFDKSLIEGKERIDHLLQKMSLISKNDASDTNARYVSGCSTTLETTSNSLQIVEADILSELGIKDFDANKLFDASLFKLDAKLKADGSEVNLKEGVRYAPDGEGNTSSENKIVMN